MFCLVCPALFLTWISFVSVVSGAQTPCPAHACVCLNSDTEARCDGGGKLSELPPLPENTTSVTALRFNFSRLTQKSFGKLGLKKLKKLHLEGCKMNVIEKDAFSEMKVLSFLAIGNANFSTNTLTAALSGLETKSLVELWLYKLGLGDLNPNVFSGSSLGSVQVLNVSDNLLREWTYKTVSKMHSLRVLNASNSPITDWKEVGHPTLEKVYFVSTRLKELPSFCDKEKSLFPKLQVLDLEDNLIRTVSTKTFSCLSALESLNISRNPFDRLPNKTFTGLQKLTSLTLDFNNISFFEAAAFNSTSIRVISLVSVSLWSRRTFESLTLFEHCPSLVWFTLCFTKLDLTRAEVRQFLLGLKNVRILIVCYSELGALPSDTFQHFPQLQKLVIPNNDIVSWPTDVFCNVRPLQRLMFSDNSIQVITEESLPTLLRSGLEYVDVSGNPFTCNASLTWFAAWLAELHLNNSVTVKDYPKRYVCSEPPDLHGQTLADAFPLKPPTFGFNSPTVIFALVAIGVLLIVGGILLIRRRSKLRNCCCPSGRRRNYEIIAH